MYKKYWQTLLFEWRKQGRDGLTIPFILGSKQYCKKENDDLRVESLILEIASNSAFEVYLSYCMTIDQIILGIRDESKRQNAGQFLITTANTNSNLFISKFLDDFEMDVISVSKDLANRYQYLVDEGNFSFNDREWGDFTSSETTFIKSCF